LINVLVDERGVIHECRYVLAFPASMLRAIKPIPLVGLPMREIRSSPPRFNLAGSEDALVEDNYQRWLTQRSITIIRKIARISTGCTSSRQSARRTNDKLCVIDGQHTGLVAASRGLPGHDHGGARDRARASVAHRTDRLNVTPLQLFASRLAAGDKGALAARQAAKGGGVALCRVQPANGMWGLGRYHWGQWRPLVAAKRAPVSIHEILAAECPFEPKLASLGLRSGDGDP
jgi:hypothetical protein